jgi:hypothetical protein
MPHVTEPNYACPYYIIDLRKHKSTIRAILLAIATSECQTPLQDNGGHSLTGYAPIIARSDGPLDLFVLALDGVVIPRPT